MTLNGTEKEVLSKLKCYGVLGYGSQTPGTQLAMRHLRDLRMVVFLAYTLPGGETDFVVKEAA